MESKAFPFDDLPVSFLVGLATIFLLYWYSVRNHGYWKKRGVPQANTYPLLGSTYEYLRKPSEVVDLERHMKIGKVYGHYEWNCAMISIADPLLLKHIFVKDFNFFSSKRLPFPGDETLENVLPAINGETWKRLRTIVSPAFSTGKIKKMTSIFNDCSKALVKNFKVSADFGKPVEVQRVYGAYAMDVIASAAFSVKIDSYNHPDDEFVQYAKQVILGDANCKLLLLNFFPQLMNLFDVHVIKTPVVNFFNEATRQIIEERQKSGQAAKGFIQFLLDTSEVTEEQEKSEKDETRDIAENYGNNESFGEMPKINLSKKHLSFKELAAQSLVFFLAGYETIAGALAFATYLLAMNEDVQEKAIEEVDKALLEHKGKLTYEAIQSLKYLDNVISESFRIYPLSAKLERVADADYKLGDTGIIIPKGMVVSIPVYAIHRDPNFYPDPEKFDPERFNADERAKRDPYTYLPFGAGQRVCLGMRFALLEIKVCLAYLLSSLRIKRCSQTKVPVELNSRQGLVTPKDIYLTMHWRTDCKLVK